MPQQLPIIQSLGLPPEKHADRIVGEMLRVIAAERPIIWPRIHAVLGLMNDGNPKAQQKMLVKFKEAAGPFYFSANLETGTRGRYVLRFTAIEVWNAETKTIVMSDDEIPDTPWLGFSICNITSKGKRRYTEETDLVLFVTHHALSRLAQRCGARTIHDVSLAARKIAVAFFEDKWPKDTDGKLRDNTRMKVDLQGDMGNAICVLRNYNYTDDGSIVGSIVVVTLWKENEEEPTPPLRLNAGL